MKLGTTYSSPSAAPEEDTLHNFHVGLSLECVTIDPLQRHPGSLPRAQPGGHLNGRCLGERLVHQVLDPTILHSDHFESKLFQKVSQLLGIKKTRTQSGSQSEMSIKTP